MPKKWTSSDEKYLIKHLGKKSNQELAEHFDVSTKSITNKLSSLRKSGLIAAEEPTAVEKVEIAAPKKEAPITPLSAYGKKKAAAPKSKKADTKQEPEGPPQYVSTSIMIMTEEGWKPINIDKRKITS